ncbi:phage recombination protein Bet [Glaesserella parasuis]|uniref:phage recombination protein Bet n=1 Tax=Glaesserella parasuis TaxID=738 RepID=UPI002436D401|nr:phage recombination protein Bet [Glaesserella parasuis]MDG6264374.1 phage recombination protein Bet [Glaesserella parasuis]
MTTNLPSNIQTALSERGIDHAVWSTLQNSIFPGAKDESILLAIDYCKARKMDILKKPCHIVPMNVTNAKTAEKEWRDVIMPGIYEQRITAFRTGQMAGQDDPVFGDTIEYLGVNAPEWCKVTVYRFVNGERCAFSHTEYFTEACAITEIWEGKQRTGKYKVNSMWTKRPRGQLAKCAEAGALRKAFPDELGGVITADEITEEPINPASPQQTVIDVDGVVRITDEQRQQLDQLIQITQTDVAKAIAYYGVNSLDQLPKDKAEHLIKILNERVDKLQAQSENLGENIPL